MTKKSISFWQRLWRFVWKSAIWFVVLSVFSTLIFRWVSIPFTPLMLIRCFEQKISGKEIKLQKNWASLQNISPNLQLAVVCSEDQHFLQHFGVDFGSLKKAMKKNEENKKRLVGGSTITMQTSKNVFLWPSRTLLRKAFELYFTVLIETLWSKERIMEVYLNVIEFGSGIYGADAASKHYFNKNAKELSKTEAAILASLLPNPRVYGKNIYSPYMIHRTEWVKKQMLLWGGKLDYTKDKESKNMLQKK